jgi:hypothetical protein
MKERPWVAGGRPKRVVKSRAGSGAIAVAVLAAAVAGPVAIAAKDVELPFVLDRRNGVIVVDGRVNDRPAKLLLDTGAAQTVIRPELVGLSATDLRLARFSGQGPGLGGEAMAGEASLTLGDRTWRRQVVLMNLGEVSRHFGVEVDGILGQDLLREFARVEIDFRAKTIRLKDD